MHLKRYVEKFSCVQQIQHLGKCQNQLKNTTTNLLTNPTRPKNTLKRRSETKKKKGISFVTQGKSATLAIFGRSWTPQKTNPTLKKVRKKKDEPEEHVNAKTTFFCKLLPVLKQYLHSDTEIHTIVFLWTNQRYNASACDKEI